MPGDAPTELMLIRHAPALHGGRLCGRTDVEADCSDASGIAALRAAMGTPDRIVASPARRCAQTAAALWPDTRPAPQPALWEQDFGDWDGMAFGDLPDLGALSSADLAQHTPPGGESFTGLCARSHPALTDLIAAHPGQRIAVVAHAGTVRAGLALALGAPAMGLGFVIDPLSLTRLTALPQGGFAIHCVNWRPA